MWRRAVWAAVCLCYFSTGAVGTPALSSRPPFIHSMVSEIGRGEPCRGTQTRGSCAVPEGEIVTAGLHSIIAKSMAEIRTVITLVHKRDEIRALRCRILRVLN